MNLVRRTEITGLDLTTDQFDKLHRELAKVRSTSATVTVDKAALAALLRDHSHLIELLERKS